MQLDAFLGQPPIVVADGGARSGVQARWLSIPYPVEFLGFEPDEEECQRLQAEPASAQGLRVRYFPVALGERAERRTLYLYKDRRLSSFLGPDEALLRSFPIDRLLSPDAFCVEGEALVDCVSLDGLCEKEGIEAVDVLKLDTQGTELEILRGATRALASALAVEVEVEFTPMYQDQPLFGSIDVYMRESGFILFDLRRHWWVRDTSPRVRSRGQVVFGDALYMRAAPDPAALPKAVMVALAFGYADYALELLERVAAEKPHPLTDALRSACIAVAGHPGGGVGTRVNSLLAASRLFRRIDREGRRARLEDRGYDNDQDMDYRWGEGAGA